MRIVGVEARPSENNESYAELTEKEREILAESDLEQDPDSPLSSVKFWIEGHSATRKNRRVENRRVEMMEVGSCAGYNSEKINLDNGYLDEEETTGLGGVLKLPYKLILAED